MLLRCTEGIDLILARTQLSVQMAPLSSSFPRLKSAFAAFRWLETPFGLAFPVSACGTELAGIRAGAPFHAPALNPSRTNLKIVFRFCAITFTQAIFPSMG